jgi:hypothetical protein
MRLIGERAMGGGQDGQCQPHPVEHLEQTHWLQSGRWGGLGDW